MGDNAEMCIIELVDYNENMLSAKEDKSKKRRSRRGGSKAKTEAPKAEEKVAEPKAEEVVEEPKKEEPAAEEAKTEEEKKAE